MLGHEEEMFGRGGRFRRSEKVEIRKTSGMYISKGGANIGKMFKIDR